MITGKVLLAPFLFCLFWISRIFELFLKISRPIVTILCAIGSVGITIGAIIHIFFYLQGRGISVWGIVLSVFFAAALMVVPAAGVGVVIVVLEGICNGIYRMYRPAMEKMNLEEEKKDYHMAECEWDEKTPEAPWKNKEECERKIHYFKGVKDKEELEKRLSGLLRIYRPEKEFADDALTRSILDDFEYLKGRLPEKAKDV